MNITYEYKLEPTQEQAQEMAHWLDICRGVWNYALAERRDSIKSRKCDINSCSIRQEYIMAAGTPRVTYASQCKSLTSAKKVLPHLKDPYSQVLQQVLQQLEKAFIGMWEQERGFPRFKKVGRMRSFLFPQFNAYRVKGDGLQLPKLGWIRMHLHRPIPEGFDIKQVRIVRRASGWYAMLSLYVNVSIPDIPPGGHPIGIDVGLNNFVAMSDGELINRPRFFIESQRKLKLLNRDVSRKQLGSKNQQKARVKVSRLYEKIHNCRKYFHSQVAHHLCDQSGSIFAEELNLKALAKGMLGKHCLDAGWGSFLNILGLVAFKGGVYFGKVDSRGTSQICPVCDTRVTKDLSVRVHDCECGYRTERDVASSQVVLKRGLAAVGQTVKKSVEDGEETNPPVKQKLSRAILGGPHYNALRV
ncbi:MAG: hypothetical protein NVS2B14_05980 [Chamaesiphon sp.]